MSVLVHGIPVEVSELTYDDYNDRDVFTFQLAHEDAPTGRNGKAFFELIEAPARIYDLVSEAAASGTSVGIVARPRAIIPKDKDKRPWVKLLASKVA